MANAAGTSSVGAGVQATQGDSGSNFRETKDFMESSVKFRLTKVRKMKEEVEFVERQLKDQLIRAMQIDEVMVPAADTKIFDKMNMSISEAVKYPDDKPYSLDSNKKLINSLMFIGDFVGTSNLNGKRMPHPN